MEPEHSPADTTLDSAKLTELLRVARENNDMLRSIRFWNRASFWVRTFLWIIVLVSPVVLLSYFGPALKQAFPEFFGTSGSSTVFGLPSPAAVKAQLSGQK